MRIAIVEDESSQRQLIAQYLGEWRRRDEPKPESVCFQNSESFLFFGTCTDNLKKTALGR